MLIPRSVINRIARPVSTAFGIQLSSSSPPIAGRPSSPTSMLPRMQPVGHGRPLLSTTVQIRQLSSTASLNNSIEANAEDATVLHSDAREKLEQAMQALRAKEGTAISESDYVPALEALAHLRDFGQAHALLTELKTAGIQPSVSTIALVLQAGRRSLRAMELKELFGDPNFRNANTAGNGGEEEAQGTAISHSLYFAQIKELVGEVRARGEELPVEFYDDLGAQLLGQNQCGVLINIAIALEGKGVQLPIRFYNRMIHALPRHGYSDRADVLFSRMIQNGLADMNTYVNRMGSLVYCNRMDAAAQVFADLRAVHGTPNEVAYNIMIKSCLEGKQPAQALELFAQMKAESTPNNITFNTFLTYGYEGQDLETVNAVLPYFFERGFPTAASEYSCLFKFYSRHDPAQCVELYRSMMQKKVAMNAELYNAFLHTLLDRQVPPEWKRHLGNLLADRVYPQSETALGSICLSLPYHTRHILARMEACQVEPTSVTFELLMRCFMVRKDWQGARNLFNHLLAQHSHLIHPVHRNMHLSALLHLGAGEDEINTALNAMRSRRCPVNTMNAERLAERGIRLPAGLYSLPHANRFRSEGQATKKVASFKDYQQN